MAELFPLVPSGLFPEMLAVLPYDPVEFTVAVIVKEALAPLAREPTVQFGANHVPIEGTALTKVYPEGSTSLTAIPVALYGPLFLAVMVNTTLFPTLGDKLSAVFVISKSAGHSAASKFLVVTEVPPHEVVTEYFTETVPSPVKLKVFPANVPGPLTMLNVPPAGVGFKITGSSTQYFESGPPPVEIGWMAGLDSAPQICTSAVAKV